MVDRATPHLEVNELLDALTDGLRGILSDKLVGAYLFGSLTSGDFDRESDIDVVVVTADKIPDETFAALQAMHARIAAIDSWCATQLEVSYIPRRAIRRYDPADALHPRLDRGKEETLHMMRHDADWVVQRHLIRERGLALLGPAPSMVIDPVSPDDLRLGMLELLPEWLAPMLENPPCVRTRGYQSFIVLSTCRILYTLETRRRAFQEGGGALGRGDTGRALDAVDPGSVDRAPESRYRPARRRSQRNVGIHPLRYRAQRAMMRRTSPEVLADFLGGECHNTVVTGTPT